ncbi:MAG TPA: hypothetical protein VFE53_18925, partial [Mucilaginibacter sp.]|nr:hypothetical protein [Mucilaginibacter sp.]
MLNLYALKQYILLNEGWRTKCYPDTAAAHNPTIGVGFNLNQPHARFILKGLGLDYDSVLQGKVSLLPHQIMALFNYDLRDAMRETQGYFPNLSLIDDVRQIVLIDMVFNLGPVKFSQFHKLIAAVNKAAISKNQNDWNDAANEMEFS